MIAYAQLEMMSSEIQSVQEEILHAVCQIVQINSAEAMDVEEHAEHAVQDRLVIIVDNAYLYAREQIMIMIAIQHQQQMLESNAVSEEHKYVILE